jgi:glycosyltransferase involved in cell wall biosynthesis
MVTLACALKHRGHSVEIFTYFPQHDFFRSRIEDCRIPVHEYKKGRGFSLGVLRALSLLMRNGNFDIVLSYLNTPNLYAELAKLISSGPRLVVSERSSHHGDKSSVSAYIKRVMHCFSDHVVANSHTHAEWLKNLWWLNGKVSCIYNGLDHGSFASTQTIPQTRSDLRLLAIGRVGPEKNVMNLIRGLHIFQEECGYVPEISWVGKQDASPVGQRYCQQVDELLETLPEIRKRWQWLGERPDIPQLLRQHHALIHPSLYEGLPNVVCEALAAGRPVLASNVCDHPRLVADSEWGFLFDPNDPKSIADAMKKMTNLDAGSWLAFSRNAREYAEANLGIRKMVMAYEAIFCKLVGHRGGDQVAC